MSDKSIKGTVDCYGCGVCAIACAKKIIDIRLNDKGFLEPYIIDSSKCTNCGFCSSVCSLKFNEPAKDDNPLKFFAAWSKDNGVRLSSSSGGIAFELGRLALLQGYKVCGVRYNNDNCRAEHFIASNLEELSQTLGSKYIQSETKFAFRQFDRKSKYLVIGTPCQIDSLRRYIRKFKIEDNFILVDFFCHGVPSRLSWVKYLESNRRLGKIQYVSFRNKFKGLHLFSPSATVDVNCAGERIAWHDSYNIFLQGTNGCTNSGFKEKNSFLRLFLRDCCLNTACFDNCKYKQLSSSADMRIGDFWGEKYAKNEDGVSSLIVYTEKAMSLIDGSNIEVEDCLMSDILSVQMEKCPNRPNNYAKIISSLQNPNKSIKMIDYKYIMIPDILERLNFFNKNK